MNEDYLIKHSVKAFEIVGPWKLRLTFEDRVEKEVDLKGIDFGFYAPLAELEYFNKVHLTDDLFTLEWPNGADFNPDTLYYWEERRAGWLEESRRWHEKQSHANSQLSEKSLAKEWLSPEEEEAWKHLQ
ncbi:MAG TPA: DUF2442 domain-containing protein [Candidatus Paceibacterota bacterium]|nr:DUF2442 domain-containing protein [Candidatus Paceibacterota bacterium]